MSLQSLLGLADGGFARGLVPGDVMLTAEGYEVATDTTNTNLTITAAMLMSGLMVRNPAGVSNENYDTAANLIAAFGGGNAVQSGIRWKYRVINLSANLLTGVFAANTGLVGTRGNVIANIVKDFAIVIRNGSLAQSFNATTTNASAVIGGLTPAQAALITPGMIVTNAVANQQGNTVLGVNASAGTVTMSGNSNATNPAPGVQFNFSPVVSIVGLNV